MAQEAETRYTDMTSDEKKAYHKEWRARNTVKARMEQAAARVAAVPPALPSRPPGYFRAMAAKNYAKQKDDLKHCLLCDCYIVSIRFANHEITKKHLRMVELQKEGYARDARLFEEFYKQSHELSSQP